MINNPIFTRSNRVTSSVISTVPAANPMRMEFPAILWLTRSWPTHMIGKFGPLVAGGVFRVKAQTLISSKLLVVARTPSISSLSQHSKDSPAMHGTVAAHRMHGLVSNQSTITFTVSDNPHIVPGASMVTNMKTLTASIGGTLGHMSYVDYAAFDPIFWFQ